jgi:hypothetical protein
VPDWHHRLIDLRDPSGQQLDSHVEDQHWYAVARFACYSMQTETLRLKPWEQQPFSAREDDSRLRTHGVGDLHRIRAAVRLRNRLEAAGLSRFEPDPPTALKKVGKR